MTDLDLAGLNERLSNLETMFGPLMKEIGRPCKQDEDIKALQHEMASFKRSINVQIDRINCRIEGLKMRPATEKVNEISHAQSDDIKLCIKRFEPYEDAELEYSVILTYIRKKRENIVTFKTDEFVNLVIGGKRILKGDIISYKYNFDEDASLHSFNIHKADIIGEEKIILAFQASHVIDYLDMCVTLSFSEFKEFIKSCNKLINN